ncbi:hypothetical protein HanPI659440_Chr14g0553051 [Helianthus annuus]|nr:hypothetical protein HanPI659440_Chr14g0553051 [Helianthus annuus]
MLYSITVINFTPCCGWKCFFVGIFKWSTIEMPPCKVLRESNRWPMVGKYKVDVASFESLALPELQCV